MKLFTSLIIGAVTFAITASATNSVEDEIKIRESDGFVTLNGEALSWMTQHDAESACLALDARLPTAVELATEATKHGSVMKKPNAEGKCTPEEGEFFDLVSDANGPLFCYSYSNYKRPEGDIGYFWVWSSTFYPGEDGHAYIFHGRNGDYGYLSRDEGFKNTSVRCFVD